ncbi:hypothetical protein HPULCUR_008809 [Helicostylum pulchrum]|uniref:Uncharacterized protein n=1 Tax=Helicostylum pulchrum TaxID=562976 RepID=A0ABP9Y9P1_9FUNG
MDTRLPEEDADDINYGEDGDVDVDDDGDINYGDAYNTNYGGNGNINYGDDGVSNAYNVNDDNSNDDNANDKYPGFSHLDGHNAYKYRSRYFDRRRYPEDDDW